MQGIQKLKLAFLSQKASSRRRNIDFLLTFEEWLNIWRSSGYLSQRGKFIGDYQTTAWKKRSRNEKGYFV